MALNLLIEMVSKNGVNQVIIKAVVDMEKVVIKLGDMMLRRKGKVGNPKKNKKRGSHLKRNQRNRRKSRENKVHLIQSLHLQNQNKKIKRMIKRLPKHKNKKLIY